MRAIDGGGLTSPWTTVAFTANAENGAPSVPTLIAPDGDVFGAASDITFRAQNATDADGSTRSYDFELRDEAGELRWSVSGVDEGQDETMVTVLAGELPVGLSTWTARAVDELGLTSDWAPALGFEIVPPGDDDDASADDDDASGDDDSAADDVGCDCMSAMAAAPGAGWGLALPTVLLVRRRRAR